MNRVAVLAVGFALALFPGSSSDLSKILSETNLEKRSKLALDNADRALRDSREAYQKGEFQRCFDLLAEVQESVELADASLKKTGKNPRKSPKWFKRAEIETRKLVKKLDAFRYEMSVADHEHIDKVKARVQQIHDDLLISLMKGKTQ